MGPSNANIPQGHHGGTAASQGAFVIIAALSPNVQFLIAARSSPMNLMPSNDHLRAFHGRSSIGQSQPEHFDGVLVTVNGHDEQSAWQ